MKKIELPENWYIKACPEFKKLCDVKEACVNGNYLDCVYFNYNSLDLSNYWKKWSYYPNEEKAIELEKIEISFDLFLKYLNGESDEPDDLQPLIKLLKEIT